MIFLHSYKFLLNQLLINFQILSIYIFLSNNFFHFCLSTCNCIRFSFQTFNIFIIVCVYAWKFEFIKIFFIKINFFFLLICFRISNLVWFHRLFDKVNILAVNYQLRLLLLLEISIFLWKGQLYYPCWLWFIILIKSFFQFIFLILLQFFIFKIVFNCLKHFFLVFRLLQLYVSWFDFYCLTIDILLFDLFFIYIAERLLYLDKFLVNMWSWSVSFFLYTTFLLEPGSRIALNQSCSWSLP